MGSLALVEEEARPAGVPDWIARSLNVKPGRDPIGLQTITLDRIMPILLPGILVLSRRARYFTFFPFLLQTFRELQLPASNDVLSEFIKLREFEFACAVHLCPNGCVESSSGAVGSSRAGPAVRGQQADATIARRESVESYLGGYGLYYRSPLIDLGLVVPKGTVLASETVTPVDVLHPDGRADALADAFREAIADTAYYRKWMLGEEPIPVEVLTEFAERACFCRLPGAPGERALIRQAFFEPPPRQEPEFVQRDVDQRRRSFALFLREVEQAPEAAGSDAAFREALWRDFVSTLPPSNRSPARSGSGQRWLRRSTCRRGCPRYSHTSGASAFSWAAATASRSRRSTHCCAVLCLVITLLRSAGGRSPSTRRCLPRHSQLGWRRPRPSCRSRRCVSSRSSRTRRRRDWC